MLILGMVVHSYNLDAGEACLCVCLCMCMRVCARVYAYMCVCIYVCACASHSSFVEIQGQLSGLSLLLSLEAPGLKLQAPVLHRSALTPEMSPSYICMRQGCSGLKLS